MRRILLVAEREFAVHARSRFFLLGVLIPTVLMVVGILVMGGEVKKVAHSGWGPSGDMRWTRHGNDLQELLRPKDVELAVTDLSDGLASEMSQIAERAAVEGQPRLTVRPVPMPEGREPEAAIRQELARGAADGWLVIPRDVMEGGTAAFYSADFLDSSAQDAAFALLDQAVFEVRLRESGLPADEVRELRKSPSMAVIVFKPQGPDAGMARLDFAAMGYAWFFMFFMFMGIFGLGQHMLTGLIEEKNSRVIEVLLSAVSPDELMAGKVLGLAAAGLVALGACAAIVISAAYMRGLVESINLSIFTLFVVYYVLGFLLASSVFAAVGSVCSQLKDMQGFMLPISLIFILPVMAWGYLAARPDGLLAVVLSLFPPTAPMAMVLRVAVTHVPAVQIVASLILLAAADAVVLKGAGRIFRTGILMYGKPPRLREMLRWARSD